MSGQPRLLTAPVPLGRTEAPSRVVFGPHETNLAEGRAVSERHVAYYARRAAGGTGVVVTETASVVADDWPYERCPLVSEAAAGWRAIASACRPYGTVVLAGLGHAGGQGSSAYSQRVMWAPSPVADVVTREPPAQLEEDMIAELVSAFARAAGEAMEAGLAGIEVDAGAHSLLRQFHSGLTNLRTDRYGTDRLLFTRQVLEAVRRQAGPAAIVALRLSCDELAPWAGVTPEQAAGAVAALAPLVDLLTVVRVGPYSTSAYRPDYHTQPGFNRELCQQMRQAAAGVVPVVLQGSVVDPAMAEEALAGGVCDLAEMTRALIADAALVAKVRAGSAPRPCIRCNQACRVRDNRNPIVSCVVDPSAGYETADDPAATPPDGFARGPVLVIGGGPAGMECARVLAASGRTVRLAERSTSLGGTLAAAAVGSGREALAAITDWMAAELDRLGVAVELSSEVGPAEVREARAAGWQVVLATGSRPNRGRYGEAGVAVLDPLDVLGAAADLPPGPVAVIDTVGDSVGVNLAEWLAGREPGRAVSYICPDPVAGTQLARTGDLADANGRLQRAGVDRRLRSIVRAVDTDGVVVEDAWTGERSRVPAASIIDCGHRLPAEDLYLALADRGLRRAGDCVAPRSALEAVLEGRRVARSLGGRPEGCGS